MRPADRDDVLLLEQARTDPSLVLLEGFHALKHARRFGAEMLLVATADPSGLDRLARTLAPDVSGLLEDARLLGAADMLAVTHDEGPHWTGTWGVARRPEVDPVRIAADPASDAPVVLLESPRHPGNAGAAIRVAAAAEAAGVIVIGDLDPWHPAVVRAAAGLQFALPVARADELPETDRAIVALDPDGEDLASSRLPSRSILAFGTERHGLSEQLLSRADRRVRIPMREGVSSLNLAVAVGVTLYLTR
jgi:TrmH family RNA methyltransferase